MILMDADPQARFLGLGCYVEGNTIVCDAVCLDADISGLSLEAMYGDTPVTLQAHPVAKTERMYNRFMEGMRFEIKDVKR